MSKERVLVKHILVYENPDIRKAKYLNVYDGTGAIPNKSSSDAECILEIGNKQYYTPFVGKVFKAKFPELVNLVFNNITDEAIIERIKQEIF